MSTQIHARALLVSLSISTWSARRYDRKVTDKVNAEFAASRDAGRYNKMLLPGDNPAYKALVSLSNALRAQHYDQTLPWSDESWRLLPTAQYMPYADWYRQRSREFWTAFETFKADYPSARAQAALLLNGMYRDEDYPTVDQLSRRFALNVEYSPVPAVGDIRVDLASDQITAIETSIRSRVETATKTAMRDAWKRLHDVVAHAADRLSSPDAIFRDSLIGNIRETCDLLARLNVTNDPDLELLRSRTKAALSRLDPEDLRDDQTARAAAARKAEDILSAIRGVYGEVAA